MGNCGESEDVSNRVDRFCPSISFPTTADHLLCKMSRLLTFRKCRRDVLTRGVSSVSSLCSASCSGVEASHASFCSDNVIDSMLSIERRWPALEDADETEALGVTGCEGGDARWSRDGSWRVVVVLKTGCVC